MKSLSSLSIILILMAVTCQAQIGGALGLSYSNFVHGSTTSMQRNEMYPSLTGGLWWKIGRDAGAIPSLMHVSKGAKTNFRGSTEYHYKTNHIQLNLPLFVRAGHFDFMAGMYGDYMYGYASNDAWFEDRAVKWRATDRFKTTSDWVMNTLRYGLTGGAQYRFHWVYVNINYTRGLRQVNKNWAKVLDGWQDQTIDAQFRVPFNGGQRMAKRSSRAKREVIHGTIYRN